MVLFTVMSFFPVVPSSVPGKLKVAGVVVTIAWLIAIRRAERPTVFWREHPRVTAIAVGLVAWTLTSAAWATDRGVALHAARQMLFGVALMLIVFTVARPRCAARTLILTYVAGGVLTIAYGVIFRPGPTTPGEVFDPTRLYGGMGDPNDLGAVLLPAIALSLFSLPLVRSRSGRLMLYAATVILVIGLALTNSRGGLAAAAVMLVAGIALAGRLRARIAASVGVLILVGVGYVAFLAPEAIRAPVIGLLRIDAYGGVLDGSGRAGLWKAAVGVIADRPMLGVGARNFRTVTGEDIIVHNTYLEVQAELGLIGSLLFLALIGTALWMTFRAARTAAATGDRIGDFQARGVFVSLIGLLAAYFFLSGEYQVQLWWLLGLAFATAVTTAPDAAETSALPGARPAAACSPD